MRSCLLSALCALALTGGALAAPPRVRVDPFLGGLAPGAWQPVTVTVENPPDGDALSGEVALKLSDPKLIQNIGAWTKPLHLAPGERTAVTFAVYVPAHRQPIADVTVTEGSGFGGATVLHKTFDGIPLRPVGVTILHVTSEFTPDADPMRNLNGQHLGIRRADDESRWLAASGSRGDQDTPAQVKTISPESLPADALALDGIAAVYVDDLHTPTPAQTEALWRYAANGGALVFGNYGETSETFGMGVMANLNVSDPLDAKAWTNVLRRTTQQSPLTRAFLADESYGYSGYSTEWATAGLSRSAPPFSTFALFLGVYLLTVIPVQYAVLKRLGKREWAWGATPAIAALFALAAFGFGQRGRSRDAFTHVASVMEMGSGEGRGAVSTSVGVFSPGLSSYDVGIDAPGAQLWTPKSTGGTVALSAPAASYDERGLPTLRGLRIPMWSMSETAVRSEATLGQGVRVTRGDDAVTVENRTGRTLRDVRLGQSAVGTLAPGQTVRLSGYSGYSAADAAPMRASMRRWVETVSGNPNTLTAWLDQPLVRVRLNGAEAPPRQSATLIAVHW